MGLALFVICTSFVACANDLGSPMQRLFKLVSSNAAHEYAGEITAFWAGYLFTGSDGVLPAGLPAMDRARHKRI